MLKNEEKPFNVTLMQLLRIVPQHKVNIDCKDFRLDFAFLLYENHEHEMVLVKKAAIECDGYQHHYDLNSFINDRERNRKLTADNWTIFHFSGSEINSKSANEYYREFHRIFKAIGFGLYSSAI